MPVSIRLATADDTAAIHAIYAPHITGGHATFETEVPTHEALEKRITTVLRRWPWLVAEESGQIIGYAYAGPHRSRMAYQWGVEASVYLAPQARGMGLGRRLYTTLFEILRAQQFVHVFAGIALPNAASVGLHESMGFTLIGVYPKIGYKAGAWRDVGWWRLGLREPPEPPVKPISLPRLDPAALEPAFSSGGG
ncbi:MAG: arsinothricin resistance N-acetyltransferase ArsN1 family B [Bradymonadia bacterium]